MLWLPPLADKYGRKRFFQFGQLIQLVLFTGLFLTTSLPVMIAIFFMFGAIGILAIEVGYVYLVEFMTSSATPTATSAWSIQEALIYLFIVVYFWQISKHWLYCILIGYVWNVVSVIGTFWLPESPRYLLSVGRKREAAQAFALIKRCNQGAGKRRRSRSCCCCRKKKSDVEDDDRLTMDDWDASEEGFDEQGGSSRRMTESGASKRPGHDNDSGDNDDIVVYENDRERLSEKRSK